MKKKIIEEEDSPGFLEYFVLWSCATFVIIMLVLAVFGANVFPNFLMTDSYCDVLVANAINQSFINGTIVGSEYIISSITQEAIQCKTIPINYANYSYNLIAVECLELLNLTGGNK